MQQELKNIILSLKNYLEQNGFEYEDASVYSYDNFEQYLDLREGKDMFFSLTKSGCSSITYYIDLDKQTVVLAESNGYDYFHVGKTKSLRDEKTKAIITKITDLLMV